MEDIDWVEEVADYDSMAAVTECRAMWLRLGRRYKSVVESFDDFFDDAEKHGTEALRWAARAEACFWRATGETEPFDVERFIEPVAGVEPAARKE